MCVCICVCAGSSFISDVCACVHMYISISLCMNTFIQVHRQSVSTIFLHVGFNALQCVSVRCSALQRQRAAGHPDCVGACAHAHTHVHTHA